MSEIPRAVTVHILDKDYRVTCSDAERDGLLAAAYYVNDKMSEIRDRGGNVIGLDRIAVMAALNIAHDLLQMSAVKQHDKSTLDGRLRVLHDKIEQSLQQGRRLDL